MFGLLLFENILPGTIKIAQSGHTGIDREHFWAELNPLRYVDEWKLDLWITVWPDLGKFRHFGQNLNLFGNILRVYLVLGTILKVPCQLLYAFGLMFIDVNGSNNEKNKFDIWSHW